MSACNALATKSELNALKSQLNASINNIDSRKADRSALNNLEVKTASLGGADNWKPDFNGLELIVTGLVGTVNFLKGAYSALAKQTETSNKAVKDAQETIKDLLEDSKKQAKDFANVTKDINQLKKDLLEQQRLSVALEYEIKNIKTKANETTAKANEAINRTNLLLNGLNNNIIKAQNAENQANAAMIQANVAVQGAIAATNALNQLITKTEVINAQAVQAVNIGNLAQSNSNLALLKIDGQALDINAIKGLINQANNNIEILQTRQSLQLNRDLDQTREIDISRAININQGIEIEELKTTNLRLETLITNVATGTLQAIDIKIAEIDKKILGGGAVPSLKSDLETFKNDLSTFKNDLSIFKVNDGLFANDLSTFKNDLSTFKNDLSTFKINDGLFANDLSTFRNDLSTFKNDLSTFKINDGLFANDLSTFRNDLSTFKNDLSTFNFSSTQNFTQINNRVGALETGLTNINANTEKRLGTLETAATTLTNADIYFDSQLKLFNVLTGNLTNTQTGIDNRVGALENLIPGLINTQTQIQKQIGDLDLNNGGKLDDIKVALGGLGLTVGAIALNTAPTKLAEAAETGVCNATKPNGCMANALNPLKKGIDDSLTNMAGLSTIAAQNAANTLNILNLLNTVWSYLQTFGNLVTGKFEKLWEHRLVDRALAAANLAVTIHNAVMLSNNIFMTLGQAIDNIGELIGIKPPEGTSTTITGAIGNTFESLAKSVIGAENYAELSINFAKANRIYQASVNILDATTAMFYGVSEGLETIARMGGKIGNACKKSGLFIENSIDWFGEKFSFKVGRLGGIMRFLQGTQEVAESIEQISSNGLEVVQNANEIKKEVDDLQKDIKDLEDKKKTDENKAKTDSKQQETSSQDLVKPIPD